MLTKCKYCNRRIRLGTEESHERKCKFARRVKRINQTGLTGQIEIKKPKSKKNDDHRTA